MDAHRRGWRWHITAQGKRGSSDLTFLKSTPTRALLAAGFPRRRAQQCLEKSFPKHLTQIYEENKASPSSRIHKTFLPGFFVGFPISVPRQHIQRREVSRRRAGGIGQRETWSVGTASWAAWEVMLGQLSCVTRPGWIWDAFGCAEGGEVSWNCAVWGCLDHPGWLRDLRARGRSSAVEGKLR